VELILKDTESNMIAEGIRVEVRLGASADSTLSSRRIGWTAAHLVAAPQRARASSHSASVSSKLPNCIVYGNCIRNPKNTLMGQS